MQSLLAMMYSLVGVLTPSCCERILFDVLCTGFFGLEELEVVVVVVVVVVGVVVVVVVSKVGDLDPKVLPVLKATCWRCLACLLLKGIFLLLHWEIKVYIISSMVVFFLPMSD